MRGYRHRTKNQMLCNLQQMMENSSPASKALRRSLQEAISTALVAGMGIRDIEDHVGDETILVLMRDNDGNQTRAAKQGKLHRNTLVRRLDEIFKRFGKMGVRL